jgi:hypothetical protein
MWATGGITLSYDPAMRLYQTAGGTPGTTRFAYDGTDLIAEYAEYNGSTYIGIMASNTTPGGTMFEIWEKW